MSLGQWAAAVVTIGTGVFLGYMGMVTFRASERGQAYEPVEATIRNSRLERDENTYRPDIEYEYTVGGETFVNDDLYPGYGYWGSNKKDKHQEIVNKYPEGAVVEAYYDPKDPSTSVLINKSMKRRAIGMMAASGLVVVFGFVIPTL